MKYENEEQIRKDFARIFNWYDYKNEYGYSSQKKELRTPEWAEIFAEIGRLKNDIDAIKLTGRLDNMDNRIGFLELPIDKKSHD